MFTMIGSAKLWLNNYPMFLGFHQFPKWSQYVSKSISQNKGINPIILIFLSITIKLFMIIRSIMQCVFQICKSMHTFSVLKNGMVSLHFSKSNVLVDTLWLLLLLFKKEFVFIYIRIFSRLLGDDTRL